ncbi:hypothetical protein [Amycolatopsis palatopharyngis]|uniref:hypothetical protein n=1 Tax=Amycolatopsis palatopharyngis TaxID=187982 RepID=UPI000E27883D|nr:hypothetical protein [Amycolatopsis palatopharyngis]
MTEKTLAEQYAEGLEAMAAMLRERPHLAEHLLYTGIDGINIPVAMSGSPAATVAEFARSGAAHSATVDKDYSGDWAGVVLRWGPVGLHVYARREQVCERGAEHIDIDAELASILEGQS